jgi:hypothetical protein
LQLITHYAGENRRKQDVGGGNLRERGHSEDLDGRIILKWILK